MKDPDFLDDMAGRLEDIRATYGHDLIPSSWPGALRRIAGELRQAPRVRPAWEVMEQRDRAIEAARNELREREAIEQQLRLVADRAADGLAEARAYSPPEPPAPPEVEAARKLAARIDRFLADTNGRRARNNSRNGHEADVLAT